MSEQEKLKIVNRINEFAETALTGIDKERVPIGRQLDALKPEMEKIASEYGVETADIFVLYMDSASTFSKNAFQALDNYDFPEDFQEFEDHQVVD